MNGRIRPIAAVVLDVDILLDAAEAQACAWMEAIVEHERDAELDAIRRLVGLGPDKLLEAATGLSPADPASLLIANRRLEILRDRYLPRVRPLPRVRDLLRRMSAEGLTVIATSSESAQDAQALLALAGADDLVDDAITGDAAARSKPDPDLVYRAICRADCSAADAVLLASTPYDIETAFRAGLGALALRSGGWRDPYLAGAMAIYDDPAHLLQHFDRTPLRRPTWAWIASRARQTDQLIKENSHGHRPGVRYAG